MNILDKLERKFGRYAIKNLMLYLTVLYTAGFMIYVINPGIYVNYLALDVSAIIHCLQLWRIISWLMYPPTTSPIFGILMLYLYYSLGTTLERTMGSFKFDCFIIGGILLHIIAAFVVYFVTGYSFYMTPDSMNMTIFLAYVFAFPDSMFLLYFFIPVRGKFMGIIYLIITAIEFITGGPVMKVQILVSIINFILFFFGFGLAEGTRRSRIISEQRFKDALKKKHEEAEKMKPQSKSFRHKCAICGKTDLDDPEMEFRYCSKCGGNYEYCMEHLFNHTHKENG